MQPLTAIAVTLIVLAVTIAFVTIWRSIPIYPCPSCNRRTVEEVKDGEFHCLFCHHEWRRE